jgi:hypothetical protein
MTKDEALRLALEALKQIDEAMPFPVAKLAQKVIKEALAQPEPNYKKALEVWLDKTEWVQETVKPHELGMHRADVLKQRIEEALAQPEQEPVAYINVEQRKLEWAKYMSWDTPTVVNLPKIPLYITPPQRKPLTIEQPKVRTGDCLLVGVCASEGHKIQPQRTWVGLTEDEIVLISADCAATHQHTDIHFARAIEAKLRSKNNG